MYRAGCRSVSIFNTFVENGGVLVNWYKRQVQPTNAPKTPIYPWFPFHSPFPLDRLEERTERNTEAIMELEQRVRRIEHLLGLVPRDQSRTW